MTTDHTFEIGKDHHICEDYALSGVLSESDMAYTIVCDGCSASDDVDFGARALAFSAREQLMSFPSFGFPEQYNMFGLSCIKRASEVFKTFPSINSQSLDATLIVSFVKNNELTCFMYGDGIVVHRSGNTTRVIHVEYLSGAPSYLSYHLDAGRMKNYNKEANLSKLVIDNIDGSFEPKSLTPFEPVIITSPVSTGDVIMISSDGINSYRTATEEPIDWKIVMEEFVGYKNFTGEFVKRRMGAFKRKCLKEGITHYDDISCATIVV